MVVHHHRAVFDVLAGVDEVDAEHVEVALLAAEVLIHADTDHVAAECDDGVAQGCALADVDALVADVLGALLPLLHEGGGDVGVLAGDDFHAFGETGQTVVLDDDVGVGLIGRRDDQMQGIEVVAAADHVDQHRLGDLARQLDHRCGTPGIPLDGGRPIAGLGDRAGDSFAKGALADGHVLFVDRGAIGVTDRDGRLPARLEHVEELSDAVERRVAPIVLLALRRGEIVHIERARLPVGARRHGRRHRVRVVRIRDGNGDFSIVRCHGNQPTDPSICSSTKRFSSSAYSIGSSRLIGSTKPRTIMPMASFSSRPRLIR